MSYWQVIGTIENDILLVSSFSEESISYMVAFLPLVNGLPSDCRGWCQECTKEDFEVFVGIYNPNLEGTSKILLRRLKESVEEAEKYHTTFNVTGESTSDQRTLELSSPLNQSIFFKWRFECDLMESGKFCETFTQPMFRLSSLLSHQSELLRKELLKKDRELDEHKENGSKLKRAHLETKAFDFNDFCSLSKKEAVKAKILDNPMSCILSKSSKNVEALGWLEKPECNLSPVKPASPVKVIVSTSKESGKITLSENNEEEEEKKEMARRLKFEKLKAETASNPRKRKQKSVF